MSKPLILNCMQAYATGIRDVKMTLHSYNNPSHEECDGASCGGGNCDNIFKFCLREIDGSYCLKFPTITESIPEDEFTFGESELNQLGTSNPVTFPSISSTVKFPVAIIVYYCRPSLIIITAIHNHL